MRQGSSQSSYSPSPVGPGIYQEIGKSLIQRNLLVPTGDKTAPLVHAVYCENLVNNPQLADVFMKINNGGLWVYNRNLWTSKGVFVIQDEEVISRNELWDQEVLERELRGGSEVKGVRFSLNGKVRFAPKGSYAVDMELSPDKIENDGLIIASYNVRGAQLLAEVSSKFPKKALSIGLDIRHDGPKETLEQILDRQRVSMVRIIHHKFRSGEIQPQLILAAAHLARYYSEGYAYPLVKIN